MPLSEPQIHRYSRQILLKEIGGVGQVRLLSAAVAVEGAGPAFETAAAYLAAGGSPVWRRGEWLEGFDPELDRAAPIRLVLAEAQPGSEAISARPSEGAQMVIGSDGAGAVIAFCAEEGCPRCFTGARAALGPAPTDVSSSTAGTLAALVCQKLLLGQVAGTGALHLDPTGTVERRPLPPCATCAQPR